MEKDNKDIIKCKSCGGNLVFSPLFECLVCEKCASKQEIEKSLKYDKHEYFIGDVTKEKSKGIDAEIHCQNCGAIISNDKIEYTKICPYCNSPYIIDFSSDDIKPDAVLPFKFDKIEAAKKFVLGIKKKHFLPNKFKKAPPTDKIEGFYIPAFSFDAKTFSSYSGRLEIDKTIRHGDRTETITTYQNISGSINLTHTDVLVESSNFLTQMELLEVEPFNTEKIYKFNPDFIRGYSVEKYNTNLEESKRIGDDLMDKTIKRSILSKYIYDRVSYLNVNTKRSEEKYAYDILPIYKVNYEYKGKKYSTVMNGQTGRVGNNLPKSKVKITFLVLSIILAVAGIITLFAMI